jgi:hypothetical protein
MLKQWNILAGDAALRLQSIFAGHGIGGIHRNAATSIRFRASPQFAQAYQQ